MQISDSAYDHLITNAVSMVLKAFEVLWATLNE